MIKKLKSILHRLRNAAIAANDSVAGTHPQGLVPLLSSAAIAARYLLVSLSSGKALTGTAADEPVGIAQDSAAAADQLIPVAVLGNTPGTLLMTAGGAISIGDKVYAAANGKVTVKPSSGTCWCVGTAISAALADGDIIEVIHRTPVSETVSGS